MTVAKGRFAKASVGLFAEVEVEVEGTELESNVVVEVSGAGWTRQGSIEDASGSGPAYAAWRSGAEVGARFALTVVGQHAVVRVTRITGMISDTNPSVVACAAAIAVWNALGVPPPEDARRRVEQAALSGGSDPFGFVPTLP